MTSIESGLTGRDVIAKTFSTRTRRGYDPIEVDAYLEQVATRIDSLIAEVERLQHATPDLVAAPPPPPPPIEVADPEPETVIEADTTTVGAALDAAMPTSTPAPEPTPTTDGSEAAQLVLQMAERASRDAIEQANVRADEIVSEAEFKASEIQREADRKAFEVSTRTQGELRAVESEIEARNSELESIRGAIVAQRDRLKAIGIEITNMADGINVEPGAVIDLSENADTSVDSDTVDAR